MLIFIIVLFLIDHIICTKFLLAQNEGLYYKNNCRTISALILAIGVLCLMGYLINYISSNYLGV